MMLNTGKLRNLAAALFLSFWRQHVACAEEASYFLSNTKCSFELKDTDGAAFGTIEGQEFSWFSRKALPKGGGLSFVFE